MTDQPYAAERVGDDNPELHPKEHVKPQVEARSGWYPYRGSEQHGVQQTVEVDEPEQSWEEDVLDEKARTYRVPLKEQDPLPVVEAWTKELVKRIVATTRAYTLVADQWVQVLGENPRRVAASFWVNPSPNTTDRIYLQTDSTDLPLGLCPFLVSGGQQIGLYQFEFTNELYVQQVGSAGAPYTLHVIEEYEIQA